MLLKNNKAAPLAEVFVHNCSKIEIMHSGEEGVITLSLRLSN